MEAKPIEEIIWTAEGKPGLAVEAARAPLLLISKLYKAAVIIRGEAFRRGWLAAISVSCPVVSIGNLTAGGSGKTTLASWLARQLRDQGERPAVVVRGWKGKRKKDPMVVSSGQGLEASVDQAGDEAVLLALGLPGVPVVAGRKKAQAASLAEKRFNPSHLLVDDGFQHLRLKRNLDLLLLPGDEDLGKKHLLPRGPLREPLSAARRAQALIFTFQKKPSRLPPPWAEDLAADKIIFALSWKPGRLLHHESFMHKPSEQGNEQRLSPGTRFFAFCGIANPERFFNLAQELGLAIADKAVFRDHADYDRAKMEKLVRQAERCKASALLTTPKDAVKIKPEWTQGMPLFIMEPAIDFMGRERELVELVANLGRQQEKIA